MIIQLFKQLDVFSVRKFFLRATQSPPGTIKAHFKLDFRTEWLNKLLYFTDERTIEKWTPQCCMVNVPSAVNGEGRGWEWWGEVLIGIPYPQAEGLLSTIMIWGGINFINLNQNSSERPQPHVLYRIKQKNSIMSALHDIIVLNNRRIPGLYST